MKNISRVKTQYLVDKDLRQAYHLNIYSNDMDLGKLKRELNSKELITRCAKEFGVVGDLNRMKICYLLCRHQELTVSDMAQACGMSVSAVSHTLKKLKHIGLVDSRREFRKVFYRLKNSQFSKVIKQSLKV